MKITLLSTALATAAMMFVACDQSGADDASADTATSTKAAKKDSGASADENKAGAKQAGAKQAGAKQAGAKQAGTVAVDKSNFDEVVLKSEQLVLVDYGAEWCGPCKIVAPIVEEIAEDYADRVVVATLDVDVAGDIATSYGVQTLPTLMVFKDGEAIDTVPMNGLPTKADIARVLDKHL